MTGGLDAPAGHLLPAEALKVAELTLCCSGDVAILGQETEELAKIVRLGLLRRNSGGMILEFAQYQHAIIECVELIIIGRNQDLAGSRLDLQAARNVCVPGGFILLMGFLDAANLDESCSQSIFQAVLDELCQSENYNFYGTYGHAGLFRHTSEQTTISV